MVPAHSACSLLPAFTQSSMPMSGLVVQPPPTDVLHLRCPAGEEPDQYRPAVSMDAVTKLAHYRNLGTASQDVEPHLHTYFGHVNRSVQDRHTAGTLNLAALKAAAGGAGAAAGLDSDDDDEEEQQGTCATSLSCSRPDTSSSSSGPCDVHGVCGAVCVHGIPLKEVFIHMPAPENFSLYLLALAHIVSQRPDVGDVYIDFGCRIKGTWQRFVKAHPELRRAHDGQQRILVNWLHGSAHELSCQLINSGRFTVAAAWRVGEATEQLWSQTKVWLHACIGMLLQY